MLRYLIVTFIMMTASFSFAATLKCSTGACHDVEKPSNSPTWCSDNMGDLGSGIYLTSRMSLSADRKNLVAVSADGDQYTSVSFDAKQVEGLQVGGKIQGTYSDNFWWSDGDHTRYTIDLNCEKID